MKKGKRHHRKKNKPQLSKAKDQTSLGRLAQGAAETEDATRSSLPLPSVASAAAAGAGVSRTAQLTPSYQTPASISGRRRHILRDMVVGLLLTATLIFIKIEIEHFYGEGIVLGTYDALQSMLADDNASVVVVDIDPIIHVSDDGVRTDRRKLGELVTFLASQSPTPRAIGIDIDFSPNDQIKPTVRQFRDQEDLAFFETCMNLRQQGLPVFLGVYRSSEGQPDKWLLKPEYQELAANMLVYVRDNRFSWYSIQMSGVPRKLKSLGGALADQYGSHVHSEHNWLQSLGFAEIISEREATEKLRVEQFLVDFGPIDKLVADRVRAVKADGEIDVEALLAAKDRLANKVVLIGSGDPLSTKDASFAVAGFHRRSYPGVYLHACAAHTLAERPLYELTFVGHLAIDIGLSFSVLGFIAGWRLWYSGKRYRPHLKRDFTTARLPKRVTFVMIFFAFVLGVLLVNKTRIMWIDFLLVIAALLLHLGFESQIEKAFHYLDHLRHRARARSSLKAH